MRWCAGLRSPRPSSRGFWRSSCTRPTRERLNRRWLCSPGGLWISGRRASILFTATDWWVRICAGSRRSRVWGHIKSNQEKFRVPRKISQGRVVVLSEGSRMGRGLLKETTMRTRHLFTSAAIAAVLAVAVPVHAQILGGGAQGGLGGTLGGTLGAGGMQGSIHGGGRGELDGLGRADRTVGAPQDGARASARAAGKAEASASQAAASARHDARTGGDLAADTASSAAASASRATASTAASAAGGGGAQTRDLNAGGALSGAASASGAGNRGTSAVGAAAPRNPA